ncbi:hypothetical protein [Hydrogenophilus thiooxidans]|uniref:hypothetical protein n=1 Tax=Hydrogenophilus thiooxidans TaxID=2820326 RepID=UPI001C231B40|nr:hypothetical protein [Hydrogenophilus thiooxidans]
MRSDRSPSWCVTCVALLATSAPLFVLAEAPVAGALPDPFRPPTTQPAAVKEGPADAQAPVSFKPQMILTHEGKRWARVGGQWLQPGSEYHGHLLVAITLTHLIWQTPTGTQRIEPLAMPPFPAERTDGLATP